MSKWERNETNGGRCKVIEHGQDGFITYAYGSEAERLIAAHNADCDAYEARIAESQRRLDAVVAMLEPGKAPRPEAYDGYDGLFRERLCRWNDQTKRYARDVAIAEGRTE
jgi:hypothetical protein